MSLPLSTQGLVLVAAVSAAFAYGDYYGHRMSNTVWQLKYDAAQQKAAEQYAARVQAYNQLADEYETAKAKRGVVYETITKTVDKLVDRPVYRNVCIDDDGLRQINAALAGHPAADPGEPAAAVPGADAAHR